MSGTEPVSALTQAVILLLSLICFLGFRQWLSRADRVLTLYMNIQLLMFWSTWCQARGRGPWLSHMYVLAWRLGVIIAIVEPRRKSHKRCLAHGFPQIVENAWKQGPTVWVFQSSPPDWMTWTCQLFNGSHMIGITTFVSRNLQWQNLRRDACISMQTIYNVPDISHN